MEPSIPPEVARSLEYYVYLYVDPRSGKPFYVGKGKGERMLAHLLEEDESPKANVLGKLREAGRERAWRSSLMHYPTKRPRFGSRRPL
jgi:hypothetical protein